MIKPLGKVLLILSFWMGASILANAQFSVNSDKSPIELVKELVDGQVEFSNVKYNGQAAPGSAQWGTGAFEEPAKRLDGIEKGVFLSTTDAKILNGDPIDDNEMCELEMSPHHKTNDLDLIKLFNDTTSQFDGAILEFDFVAKGDSICFNYVFGSDEYPDYVCSKFNDVFGFFLNGPGILGPFSDSAVNIAMVPGKDLPVAINSINQGKIGDGLGFCQGNSEINVGDYCYEGEGLKNSDLFINNLSTPSVMDDMAMNGFTKKMTAVRGGLICGETYHIKLAVTDVSDYRYPSTVFLERGSFKVISDTLAALASLELPKCFPLEVKAKNKVAVPKEIWIWGDGSDPDTLQSGGQLVKHTYAQPGKYIIKLIGLNEESCIKTDTLIKEIELTANEVVVNLNDFEQDTVCLNKGIVLSLPNGSPEDGVYSGPGITDTTLVVDSAGVGLHTIYYSLTDSNGCIGIDSTQIYVDHCMGKKELMDARPIVQFIPNPAKDRAVIYYTLQNSNKVNLALFDLKGKLVKTIINRNEISGEHYLELNLSEIPSGVFLLKFHSPEQQDVERVIIMK